MEVDLDARPIEDISKDLAEVDDVIRVTQEFMSQYPDEPTIELGLQSLEYKKQLLFDELITSNNYSKKHAFDIVFDGEPVRDKSISLYCLGDMLNSFQEIIKSIVSDKIEKNIAPDNITKIDIKRVAQLNILAMSTGSFRVIIAPTMEQYEDYTFDKHPSLDALDMFNQLISCADNTDEIKRIKLEVGTQTLSKYRNFVSNLKKYNLNVKFNDKLNTDYATKKEISSESAKKIYEAIQKVDVSEKTESFTGKLKAIDTLERHFTFLTNHDLKIKGKYDKHLDNMLSNPNFDEEIHAVFTHIIKSNDILNKNIEDWILTGYSSSTIDAEIVPSEKL